MIIFLLKVTVTPMRKHMEEKNRKTNRGFCLGCNTDPMQTERGLCFTKLLTCVLISVAVHEGSTDFQEVTKGNAQHNVFI